MTAEFLAAEPQKFPCRCHAQQCDRSEPAYNQIAYLNDELDTYLCKVGIRLIRLQPELQGVETFAATWQGF